MSIGSNNYSEEQAKEASFIDYILLMKPRVMSLVVFTAICGMLLAPQSVHPLIAFEVVLFIALGAGGAAAINMWYDLDIDRIMRRTQKRPTATGLIDAEEALAFGVIFSLFSVFLMALFINLLSAIFLAITILYYVFIYTMWLKRSSIYNVVIGGVSGALPPVIGWSAVMNNISIEAITLFLIIFAWTPPHSWALALLKSEEYNKCKIPMMPVVKGILYTKKQIIYYTILMIVISLLPYFLEMANKFYLLASLALNAGFLYFAIKLHNSDNNLYARKLFWYSIFYLFAIFALLVLCQ